MKVLGSSLLQVFGGQLFLKVDDGDGHGRNDPESGELGDSLFLAEGRILVAINSPDAENSPELISPLIHFGDKIFTLAIVGLVELDN